MPTIRRNRRGRLFTLAAAPALLTALLLPLGASTASAEAYPRTVTLRDCTLTLNRPYESTKPGEVIQDATHWGSITCNSNRKVTVYLQAMENDGSVNSLAGDDKIGKGFAGTYDLKAGVAQRVSYRATVPDWDKDHRADIFTLGSFRIHTGGNEVESGLAQSRERVIPIKPQ
ncbi:hypothetical protein GCM10023081_44580 [Arthrobacter ginkgonis]|uniref:Spore coat protein U domain-containing protein n=1 Tax=Arthrobacter ginkgonis TaxID=1630594 RepID=A0ABP7DEL9_9MICC